MLIGCLRKFDRYLARSWKGQNGHGKNISHSISTKRYIQEGKNPKYTNVIPCHYICTLTSTSIENNNSYDDWHYHHTGWNDGCHSWRYTVRSLHASLVVWRRSSYHFCILFRFDFSLSRFVFILSRFLFFLSHFVFFLFRFVFILFCVVLVCGQISSSASCWYWMRCLFIFNITR